MIDVLLVVELFALIATLAALIRARRRARSGYDDRRALHTYAMHGERNRAHREKTRGKQPHLWCVCDACLRARSILGVKHPPAGSKNPERYS